ncbi:MAG: phosphoadenosine phosphosulfate reductase family protein [Thermoplasmata archaeon]
MKRKDRRSKEPRMVLAPTEGLSLEGKIRVSEVVVQDALARFHNPVVMWTGGKDSMLALWYVREACKQLEKSLPPVLFIDHGLHFDETWQLLDQVASRWGLQKIVWKNEDVLSHASGHGSSIRIRDLSAENRREAKRTGFGKAAFPYSLGDLLANHLLKTVPMNEAILEHRFDGVVTGIRWDEDEARSRERFISARENPPHARVHPILHFTEREVWMETLKNRLPLHPLYEQGWRSIDGKFDSHRVADVPAWEQDLEGTVERAGRAQDKEQIMERLRKLGYM